MFADLVMVLVFVVIFYLFGALIGGGVALYTLTLYPRLHAMEKIYVAFVFTFGWPKALYDYWKNR